MSDKSMSSFPISTNNNDHETDGGDKPIDRRNSNTLNSFSSSGSNEYQNIQNNNMNTSSSQNGASDKSIKYTNERERLEKLNTYIYDFLMKSDLKKTAKEFENEYRSKKKINSNDNNKSVTFPLDSDTEKGFLFEWWQIFWDLFNAKTHGSGSSQALQYCQILAQQKRQEHVYKGLLAHTARTQQMAEQKGEYDNDVLDPLMFANLITRVSSGMPYLTPNGRPVQLATPYLNYYYQQPPPPNMQDAQDHRQKIPQELQTPVNDINKQTQYQKFHKNDIEKSHDDLQQQLMQQQLFQHMQQQIQRQLHQQAMAQQQIDVKKQSVDNAQPVQKQSKSSKSKSSSSKDRKSKSKSDSQKYHQQQQQFQQQQQQSMISSSQPQLAYQLQNQQQQHNMNNGMPQSVVRHVPNEIFPSQINFQSNQGNNKNNMMMQQGNTSNSIPIGHGLPINNYNPSGWPVYNYYPQGNLQNDNKNSAASVDQSNIQGNSTPTNNNNNMNANNFNNNNNNNMMYYVNQNERFVPGNQQMQQQQPSQPQQVSSSPYQNNSAYQAPIPRSNSQTPIPPKPSTPTINNIPTRNDQQSSGGPSSSISSKPSRKSSLGSKSKSVSQSSQRTQNSKKKKSSSKSQSSNDNERIQNKTSRAVTPNFNQSTMHNMEGTTGLFKVASNEESSTAGKIDISNYIPNNARQALQRANTASQVQSNFTPHSISTNPNFTNNNNNNNNWVSQTPLSAIPSSVPHESLDAMTPQVFPSSAPATPLDEFLPHNSNNSIGYNFNSSGSNNITKQAMHSNLSTLNETIFNIPQNSTTTSKSDSVTKKVTKKKKKSKKVVPATNTSLSTMEELQQQYQTQFKTKASRVKINTSPGKQSRNESNDRSKNIPNIQNIELSSSLQSTTTNHVKESNDILKDDIFNTNINKVAFSSQNDPILGGGDPSSYGKNDSLLNMLSTSNSKLDDSMNMISSEQSDKTGSGNVISTTNNGLTDEFIKDNGSNNSNHLENAFDTNLLDPNTGDFNFLGWN